MPFIIKTTHAELGRGVALVTPCGVLLPLLLIAGCATARTHTAVAVSKGPRCAANLQMYRDQVAKALAQHTIDQPVFEDQQRHMAKIEKICAAGDEDAANALLLDAAMGLSLGADDAYARSRKAGTD